MQTLIFINPSVRDVPGTQPRDSEIETSGLTARIKETFLNLKLPPHVGGIMKLYQKRNNPDVFDLVFYANIDSDAYEIGTTYTAPDLVSFERTDFEDYSSNEATLQKRLNEFTRRLIDGSLQPTTYNSRTNRCS